MTLPTDSVPIPPPTPSTESPDRLLRTYGRTNEEGVVTRDRSPTFSNARGSEKPRLLDLFCGAGGCSAGYAQAGFEVAGVDKEPHPAYPYTFSLADAVDFLEEDNNVCGFDVIHASPPCQVWTAYRRRGDGVGEGYPALIGRVRELLIRWGGIYVIENVPGARKELRNPVQFCGSSFGLDVRRHRLFESNAPLMAPPCQHGTQRPRFAQATNRTTLRKTVEVGVWRIPLDVQQRAMGIDWMSLEDLTEAVPPAYTEHIGGQILDQMRRAA